MLRVKALITSIIAAMVVPAAFGQVVISQVYGGGGNSSPNATYTNDYIELFNRGTSSVSLNGMSLQYASATGTGNFGITNQITVLPNVSIAAGKYYLVQEASGGANGVALPTADTTSTINLSATGGKVALVDQTTSLGCNGGSTACNSTQLSHIKDLVGYGSANFFEGSAAAPAASNVLAVFRKSAGCTDTDQNGSDFQSATPSARNSSTAANACAASTNPSGTGAASPSSVPAGNTTLLTVAVTAGSNPTSTGLAVTCDLTPIGGSATQSFFDNGTNGDVTSSDNTFSFSATVNGSTSTGSKSISCSISDAQSRTGSATISLSVTAPVTITTISAVQGTGNTSPFVGQTVQVTGIVTGLRSNGFYIQSDPGDGNDLTSDGIFVFTGSGNVPASAVSGNKLDVTGVVSEFVVASFPDYTAPPGSATLTELGAPLSYNFVSSGNPLPAAVTIDASKLSATAGTANDRWSQLERYENMRVTVSNFRVTQNVSSVDLYGTLSTAATPYRETGVQADKLPTGTAATVPVWDANPEVLEVNGAGLTGGSASFDLPFGSTIASITGILDYNTEDGVYTIRTNAAGVGAQTSSNLSASPVPAALSSDFTIATMNVENFSSNNAAKMAKTSLTIRDILGMPDVIGVQEMNTLASLQALATKIDQDATAAGQSPPNYTAVLLQGNSGAVGNNTTQNVGFLYKASKLQGVGAASQGGVQANTYTNPINSSSELTFDRPPLIISGTAKLSTSDSGVPFTLVVNHLKSLIDLDNATNDPGAAGIRNQTKRHFEAKDTANVLNQLNTGSTNLVSMGDHNAYQFNDGYVDVVNCVRGAPPAANAMIYQPPAGQGCVTALASQQLTNLTDSDPSTRFSYYHLGSRQTLDHILVNSTANTRVRAYAPVSVNGEFRPGGALANDTTRPERYADHNPQMVYLTLPNEVTSKTSVAKSGLIYNRSLGAYTGTITVKNTSAIALTGPLHVFFYNLHAGVTLANSTGTFNGVPYITINTSLNPGASSPAVAVRFATNPATQVTYNAKVYSVTF